jgi:surfactin synthase thioesterase subunit
VCFPHAGGSASYYYALSELLAPAVEICALQYPGRQDRRSQPGIEKLSELADQASAAIAGLDDRPLALFGHSMGSTLAFEVALRLQERGRCPVTLFASGYPAPSRLRGGNVHRRDDAGVVAELRLLAGTDPAWLEDPDLLAAFLPPIRSDYTAIETHPRDPGSTVECPITMFVGDNDPHTTLAEARAWQEHTSEPFDLQIYSGGHFFLDDHWQQVADAISAGVDRLPSHSIGGTHEV